MSSQVAGSYDGRSGTPGQNDAQANTHAPAGAGAETDAADSDAMIDVDIDLALLEPIFARYEHHEGSLIHMLQDAQRVYGYLPRAVMLKVAQTLGTPLAKVFSVATFYRGFYLAPQARTVVKVCTGTACHMSGAQQLLDELERQFHVAPDQTAADLSLGVKTVRCVGACAMAPVLMVNDTTVAHARAAHLRRYLDGGEG